MNCEYIHDDLKENEELICPFCDQLLAEVDKVVESCCSELTSTNVM